MKNYLLILLSILSIGCYSQFKPNLSKQLYDTDIETVIVTNVIDANGNTVDISKLPSNTDPYKGRAAMDGIYLTDCHGTWNAAKWKNVNGVQYWACGVNTMMFGQDLLSTRIMHPLGNIYTEKSQITLLSNNHRTPYGTGKGKSYQVVLRGANNSKNYSTNILLVYDYGWDKEAKEWLANLTKYGPHLTYFEYENGWFGRQNLLWRRKNGWVTYNGCNIQLVKAGRNTPWENFRNRQGLGKNPTHDYWLVRAFSGTRALYRDSITGSYLAVSLDGIRKFDGNHWGRDNLNNGNMNMLSIAPPISQYRGPNTYTVVSDSWKHAILSTAFTLAENYALLTSQIVSWLWAESFNNGYYNSRYKELSWDVSSESGWLYKQYDWEHLEPWGFMLSVIYWQDEYGHLMNY